MVHELIPMKRPEEISSPNFLILRWKLAHAVLSRDTACLWDKFLRVILKPGKCEILSSVDLEERLHNSDIVLLCESRVYPQIQRMYTQEPRVTNGSDDSGDLSLRDACLGKPRVCAKIYFTLSNVDSRCKNSSGQGMKGGHTAAHKNNNKESPLCCIDGHPLTQKYMYTTEKCSKEQQYLFTWEIVLCLMNLYIVKKFCCQWVSHGRKFRNRIQLQSTAFRPRRPLWILWILWWTVLSSVTI